VWKSGGVLCTNIIAPRLMGIICHSGISKGQTFYVTIPKGSNVISPDSQVGVGAYKPTEPRMGFNQIVLQRENPRPLIRSFSGFYCHAGTWS